jgi:WD40 repeat protein
MRVAYLAIFCMISVTISTTYGVAAQTERGICFVPFLPHNGQVTDVVFLSTTMQIVSSGAEGGVKLWDIRSNRLVYTLNDSSHSVDALAISPDESLIATADSTGRLALRSVSDRRLVWSVSKAHSDMIRTVFFSRDGAIIVTASNDHLAKAWDARTGRLIHTFKGHDNYISAAALTADATTLVTGGGDKAIRLWDVRSGKLIRNVPLNNDHVSVLAFVGGTHKPIVGDAKGINVWNPATDKWVLQHDFADQ